MKKLLLVVLSILLLTVGCSKEKQVGSEDLLKGINEKGEGERIGAIKRSPTPPPPPSPSPQPTKATAPPPPPPTQAARAPTAPIEINSAGFKPFNLTVFKGTTIKVTNADAQPRSLTSDQDNPRAFDTGMLQPGQSFSFVANTVGEFNFHDETRPFVVGRLTVVAQ